MRAGRPSPNIAGDALQLAGMAALAYALIVAFSGAPAEAAERVQAIVCGGAADAGCAPLRSAGFSGDALILIGLAIVDLFCVIFVLRWLNRASRSARARATLSDQDAFFDHPDVIGYMRRSEAARRADRDALAASGGRRPRTGRHAPDAAPDAGSSGRLDRLSAVSAWATLGFAAGLTLRAAGLL